MDTIKAPNTEKDALKPTQHLYCSCCGSATMGRQWWNRDTGYGVCPRCVDWMKNRERTFSEAPTDEEITRLYGVRGIHWDC